MPLPSFLRTHVLRVYFPDVEDEMLEAAEEVGRRITRRFFEDKTRVRRTSLAETSARVLKSVAQEIKTLASWLSEHCFQVRSVLGEGTPDRWPAAYYEDLGMRVEQSLMLGASRIEAALYPSEETLAEWRDSLPKEVPEWEPEALLELPPPIRPPTRTPEAFLVDEALAEVALLREFLRLAAGRVDWMTGLLRGGQARARSRDQREIAELLVALAEFRRLLISLATFTEVMAEGNAGEED
jgi:hypothetical protein